MIDTVCETCGALWSQGQWNVTCEECGGGALKIQCPVCQGQCGAEWARAVLDSHDFGRAHWSGQCRITNTSPQKAVHLSPIFTHFSPEALEGTDTHKTQKG